MSHDDILRTNLIENSDTTAASSRVYIEVKARKRLTIPCRLHEILSKRYTLPLGLAFALHCGGATHRRVKKEHLREGYTTGTAAAAAAKAATLFLLTGKASAQVATPLPDGGSLFIPVEGLRPEGDGVRAVVIKDAGDDPDVTHGAAIECVVLKNGNGTLSLEGGRGVGRVTKSGLPVPVGEAAINPAPKRQILEAVEEARREAQSSAGLRVVVEVPEGERLAAKTLNPRLGIVGGISILGTGGTVKPYSHEAWKAVIDQGLGLATAQGQSDICFSTGRRSEKMLMQHLPHLPAHAFIQAGDFFAHAMHAAKEKRMRRVVWGVLPGKLFKQAAGLENTHAKHAPMDFESASKRARDAGIAEAICDEIAKATTAAGVLEMIESDPAKGPFLESLVHSAAAHAEAFSEKTLHVDYVLFSLAGDILHTTMREAS